MEKLTNIKLRRSEATVSLTPSNVKEADGVSSKCLICLKNQSRYTCPRCGLNYCCLECYKSDRHQECSEQFYKKEVEKVLRSEEVSTESKKELIEMLKRDKIEREKDEIEFEKILNPEKFENLDINPETEELLALLSPEEKALFEACLADNSILAEIQSAQKYWWDENFKIIPDSAPALKSPGPLPVKPHWTTELFVINLIIGYVFVMRRYLCDPQDLVHEFTDELVKVCLCLSDKPEISEDSVVGSAVQAILELADKDVCLQSLTDATIILKHKLKIRHALSWDYIYV